MASNTVIQLKKSGITGNTPNLLNYGELAINYADGKLYYQNGVGVKYITNQKTFDTINVNSTLIIATTYADTLSITSSNGITVTANTMSKTINIDDGITYTLANNANSLAQAAYNYANTISAGTMDDWARSQANLAYDQANTADILAQAAFDKANTGNSGVITIITGNNYSDYGWIGYTPAPVYFDYGTL